MSGERRFENGRWWQWDGQAWLLEPEAPPESAVKPSSDAGSDDEWDGNTSDPEYRQALAQARADTRKPWPSWLIMVIVFGALAFIGYSIFSQQSAKEAARKSVDSRPTLTPASQSSVTYKVHGTARAVSITVQTPTGTSQSDTNVPLTNKGGTEGLSYEFAPGEFVYISAQNKDETGSVECIIEVDGVVVSRNSASGAFVIAQCDAQS